MRTILTLIAILSLSVSSAQRYLRVDYRSGTIHVDSLNAPKQSVTGNKELRKLKLTAVETLDYFTKDGWDLVKIQDAGGINNTAFVVFWFKKEE